MRQFWQEKNQHKTWQKTVLLSALYYKVNVFHFSVYTVIYLLQIWRFCILFSLQLHGLHKIFPFLWGILFIFFPPFHFLPSPVSFFLSGNMWCRLVKGKTSFIYLFGGKRDEVPKLTPTKKSCQGVHASRTNNTLIDQTDYHNRFAEKLADFAKILQNFQGYLGWKTISKKWLILWEFSGQIL